MNKSGNISSPYLGSISTMNLRNQLSNETNIECRDYHSMNITNKCLFVTRTKDCEMDDGFLNYLSFIFCTIPSSLEALGLVLILLWWLVLFIALATTADKFFCPSLAVMSKTLRMSESLAGVTFLAFGNGSPDIFSAISAVGTTKDGGVGLAFGALLGAGVYVTTVVTGSIAIAQPFKSMERPLLKDMVFYIAAVFWTFTIIYKQKIYVWEAFGFIGMYAAYVLVTLVARVIYQHQKRSQSSNAPLLNVVDERQITDSFVPNVSAHQVTIQTPRPQSRILFTPPENGSVRSDLEDSGQSLCSSRSSLNQAVGIMAPNYMARWLVAHDQLQNDEGHHHQHHHQHEARIQRSASLTNSQIDISQPPPEQSELFCNRSLDDGRTSFLSDTGARQEVNGLGHDNPSFIPDDELGVSETTAAFLTPLAQCNPDYGATLSDVPNHSILLGNAEVVGEEEEFEQMSPAKEFLMGILPIDYKNWNKLSRINRCYEIIKAPILFLLLIVTPVVDCDLPKHGWNKYLLLLNSFLAPNFCCLVTKVSFMTVAGDFPAWGIVLPISVVIPVLIFFTSRPEKEPGYHPAFAFLGFVTSIIWIYVIANEIVNILESWGIVFNISNAILGLTFLAWGNSVGDTISNVVMAREGYPRMAISACFGGPLFNLLLGIGIPFSILSVKHGGAISVNASDIEWVLVGGLLASLLSSLIILPIRRFKIERAFGIYLILLYFVFLTIAVLVETKVIQFSL